MDYDIANPELAAEGAADGPVISLAGHYDSLMSEGFEFGGANDGGSSTGAPSRGDRGAVIGTDKTARSRQRRFRYSGYYAAAD